jgi:5,5'-dehydrodivanillate O-demethylase oxygenase subunit
MAATQPAPAISYTEADFADIEHVGPGRLAGRYLRTFWHPAYRSEDLPAGQAKPTRLLGEDFTLYRGESGDVHAVGFRCAHRGTQMSTGWVEGENIRCFYHGWVYDGSGQCVEQPAEPEPFCNRIKIKSYPVEDYLGIIFIYMRDGTPPPMPRYLHAERAILRQVDTQTFPFNFWQALDNKMDYAHHPFVHVRGERVKPMPGKDGYAMTGFPELTVEETDWGYSGTRVFDSGLTTVEHILMPVGYLHKSRPGRPFDEDPDGGWEDTVRWSVPIDDEHMQDFSLYLANPPEEIARAYPEKRRQILAELNEGPGHDQLVRDTLDGKLTIQELAQQKVPGGKLQDSLARWGQGNIADRSIEHLGFSDRSALLYRRLFMREMRKLAEGQPLKQWGFPEGLTGTYVFPPEQK